LRARRACTGGVRARCSAPRRARPGSARQSLRTSGTNRALCSIFRRPLAQIARCVICDCRHLPIRFCARLPDLGFFNNGRRQWARAAQFGPIGHYTSAHLCHRPSKSTAHLPICAIPRALPPGAQRRTPGAGVHRASEKRYCRRKARPSSVGPIPPQAAAMRSAATAVRRLPHRRARRSVNLSVPNRARLSTGLPAPYRSPHPTAVPQPACARIRHGLCLTEGGPDDAGLSAAPRSAHA
jgi:hypothetical protein